MRCAVLCSLLVHFVSFVCVYCQPGNAGGGQLPPLPQTNLLFIMFDDLRPELSIYGKHHMITPNFERLASRSVIFDLCVSQVAVCNPSRDSLLTGLRPDTMGTYNFQTSYSPNPLFINHLVQAGYKTAGFGKIRHWDGSDASLWTQEFYNGDWYGYQNWEWDMMNSTVMPDKDKAEETFPDYIFTSKTIAALRQFHAKNAEWHMTAIGFKMPHTALHVPFKYFDMYRNRKHVWSESESSVRQFPPTSPAVTYRCCADRWFKFMNNEGSLVHSKTEEMEDMNQVLSANLYMEMMWGYSAAITFVDKQLGRILDVIDELHLWNNLTIVLTADHGMHNGEKGLWEKWTVFDEATRVPLIIAHPLSPFKGQHYTEAVELVDVFPTVLDLLNPKIDRNTLLGLTLGVHEQKKKRPGGKSLAPVVIGYNNYALTPWRSSKTGNLGGGLGGGGGGGGGSNNHQVMPVLAQTFGISQAWKCAIRAQARWDVRNYSHLTRHKIWYDCDINNKTVDAETSVMGYSMRSSSFRYTAWIEMDRTFLLPKLELPIFEEELYDHRGETLGDLTKYERENVATKKGYEEIVASQRDQLLSFLALRMVYREGNQEAFQKRVSEFRESRKNQTFHLPQRQRGHHGQGSGRGRGRGGVEMGALGGGGIGDHDGSRKQRRRV